MGPGTHEAFFGEATKASFGEVKYVWRLLLLSSQQPLCEIGRWVEGDGGSSPEYLGGPVVG